MTEVSQYQELQHVGIEKKNPSCCAPALCVLLFLAGKSSLVPPLRVDALWHVEFLYLEQRFFMLALMALIGMYRVKFFPSVEPQKGCVAYNTFYL